MKHCKIKYKGSIRSNTVIVDTMETAKQSGPGYVKRVLALFGITETAPWPELEIEFSLHQGKDSWSRVTFKHQSFDFQWHIEPNSDEWGLGGQDEWPWLLVVNYEGRTNAFRGLVTKEQYDKVIVKEIIEILIK